MAPAPRIAPSAAVDAALGAVGVAGLSAFILQFFHPFDVTLLDLGAHLAGVLVLIAAMTLIARPAIGRG